MNFQFFSFSQCLFSYIFVYFFTQTDPTRTVQRSAFWDSIPKRCKGVHFIDLGESFPNSNAYLLAKFGFDAAENEPFKVR